MNEHLKAGSDDLAPDARSQRMGLDELAVEKTRSEVDKLKLEVQELKAWRAKLIFTAVIAVLAPLGSIGLFISGWFGIRSHSPKR